MPAAHRSFPFSYPSTPHTLEPSRFEDLKRVDAESQSYSMAYPFPRFASAPQTPQHVPDSEKSSPMTCPNDSNARSKRTAVAAFIVFALFLWMISPLSGTSGQTDKVPFSKDAVDDYFSHFEGHQDCGFASKDVCTRPIQHDENTPKHTLYCRNRATLLEAMSEGGRHGFERAYSSAGCHYRWYSTTEICMILERFDAIVFVGDDSLKHVYAAFNMLLRENIAMGGLKQWDLTESERLSCRCDNQFMRAECSKHFVTDSMTVSDNDETSGHKSPYYCNRTPHIFLPITASPAPSDLHVRFTSLLAKDPDAYKPIPVIHSLSLSTSLSLSSATSSMDEWVSLADSSGRNVPYLWMGPNAAGHLKPPGQILSEGNNAIWHYTLETAKEAKARQIDALGMYNLTLQANSWDGSNYGLRVGLVQAMMVINWLSRVDSS